MGAAAFRIMRERMADKATSSDEELDEAYFVAPMLEYIKALEEDVSIKFQDRMEEVELFLKKNGEFTAKTIKALDALVEEIKG